MHPWQPAAVQRPGKRTKTKEQVRRGYHTCSVTFLWCCKYQQSDHQPDIGAKHLKLSPFRLYIRCAVWIKPNETILQELHLIGINPQPPRMAHMLAQVEERRQRLIRSFCAKAPVYENCRMLSHDGEPLSFIDYRKLAWYEVGSLLTACEFSQKRVPQSSMMSGNVSGQACCTTITSAVVFSPTDMACSPSTRHGYAWTHKLPCQDKFCGSLNPLPSAQARGLAERVAEDPPTIRLLFRHKNEDQVTGTDQFYSERKRNCCVACGEADHYLRYRVRLCSSPLWLTQHLMWLFALSGTETTQHTGMRRLMLRVGW